MLNVINTQGPVQVANGVVYTPLGQQVFFVHHNGASFEGLDSGLHQNLRTSINSALASCRSGRGDIIQLLPGHADTVAAADAWSNLGSKTGIKIIGPAMGPPATVTWTATAGTVLLDQNDIVIDGGRQGEDYGIVFHPAATGVGTVAAPFTVTGSRCAIRRCQMVASFDADDLVTDLIHVNAATWFALEGNRIVGTTGTITTALKTTGAATGLSIIGNYIAAPVATAASGVLIDISNAAIAHVRINGNLLHNTTASSKFVLKPHASSSGEVSYNRVGVDDTATAATGLGSSTFTTLLRFYRNELADDDGIASVQMGTAAT